MRTNKTTKQKLRAVIYARARGASRDQEERAIQVQIRSCRNWAESHVYNVAKVYVDRGKEASGNLQEREGLKELLTDTVNKQRAFSVILVHKFDRLFRNVLEFAIFQAILEREDIRLNCMTEPMVGSDITKDFVREHMLIVPVVEFYSRNVSCESKNWRRQSF
jgi:site-specific DNA recombinase